MKRFVVLTCLWQRHELAAIVLRFYARQRERLAADFAALGYDVDLLAVGSEGSVSRYLAEDAGWQYAERSNQPLSDKWNAGVRHAHVELGADVIYIVGSDDLSSDAYMLEIVSMMAGGADLAGSLDCYLASPRLKRALHILPTRHTDRAIIGAGRAVSRRATELCNCLPYEPGKGWGIDPSMDRRLAELGVKQSEFMLENVPGAMLLDVKTSENIWPYLFFRDMGLPEDYDEVVAYFGDETARRLGQLRDDGDHEYDEFLDPLLHRIAASILALMIPPSAVVVEVGRQWDFGRKLQETLPNVQHVARSPDEAIGVEHDAVVIFDPDLTVDEHFAVVEQLPHNSHVVISVPQAPFESYQKAEEHYRKLLPDFSIHVIGRWWLGHGTKLGDSDDAASLALLEQP